MDSNAMPSSPAGTVAPTFEALFVVEYPKMVALAAAVSGSRTFAEDIAQESMSRMHDRWAEVQHLHKPGAWVRRVTINLALSQKRRRFNEAKALLRLRSVEPSIRAPRVDDEGVWRVVAELPKKQRAAVALYFLEDRTTEEIAEILDISRSTARVHLHRARETLRTRLQEEGLT